MKIENKDSEDLAKADNREFYQVLGKTIQSHSETFSYIRHWDPKSKEQQPLKIAIGIFLFLPFVMAFFFFHSQANSILNAIAFIFLIASCAISFFMFSRIWKTTEIIPKYSLLGAFSKRAINFYPFFKQMLDNKNLSFEELRLLPAIIEELKKYELETSITRLYLKKFIFTTAIASSIAFVIWLYNDEATNSGLIAGTVIATWVLLFIIPLIFSFKFPHEVYRETQILLKMYLSDRQCKLDRISRLKKRLKR